MSFKTTCFKCKRELSLDEVRGIKLDSDDDAEFIFNFLGHHIFCDPCNIEKEAEFKEMIAEERRRNRDELNRYNRERRANLSVGYVRQLLKEKGMDLQTIDDNPEIIELTKLHLVTKRELKKLKR